MNAQNNLFLWERGGKLESVPLGVKKVFFN